MPDKAKQTNSNGRMRELEEQVLFLKSVFDATDEGICVLDTKLQIIYANKWYERIQQEAGDWSGKNCYKVFQLFDEPCPWCPCLKALKTRKAHYEIVPWPAENPNQWLLVSAYPLCSNGSIHGIVEYVRDVTEGKRAERELREREEMLRRFSLACSYGFGMGEIDGQVIHGNQALVDLVEEESIESFTSEQFWTYYTEEDQARLRDEILPHVLKEGQWVGELPLLTKKGNLKQTEQNVFLIHNDQGDPWLFGNILTDISDRKRIQNELIQRNAELEEFTYIVSHDLQEPLRRIKTFSQLLKKSLGDNLSKDQKRHFGFLIDSAERMGKLIKDLLELSRIGSAPRNGDTCNMSRLVRKVVEDLGDLMGESNAEIEVAKLPTIKGNASLISQLMGNILSNALKYHRKNTKSYVKVYASTRSGQEVICVEDNGIGIDEKYHDQIFKPFTRLHRSDEYTGSGVGLTICKRIVDKHGWTMDFESTPGKGSIFWFTFGERNE